MIIVKIVEQVVPVQERIQRGTAAEAFFLGGCSGFHAAAGMKGVCEVQHRDPAFREFFFQPHRRLEAPVCTDRHFLVPQTGSVKHRVIMVVKDLYRTCIFYEFLYSIRQALRNFLQPESADQLFFLVISEEDL